MARLTMRHNRMFQAASIPLLLALATACGSDFASPVGIAQAAEGIRIAGPVARIVEPKGQQVAIFAGGCFWGIEAVFEGLKGVSRVESGYAGGTRTTADYDTVSSGITGHAEAVRIYYDPAVISYNDLLHIFFSVTHDPTQLNRQGPDRGAQYRTAIFASSGAQQAAARAYITQLGKAGYWRKKIVTRIEQGSFYPAESYHQNFMANNPRHPYIVQWDKPKIANLKRLFPNRLR